jgi:virulence factor Mce-like protein
VTRVRQRAAACVVLAALVAVVAYAGGGDDGAGHTVVLDMPEASGVIAGQDVRLAGAVVGHVASVDVTRHGAAARVELDLSDDVWPLRAGTDVTLRWGGTVNLRNRYFELHAGPPSGTPLADGATLSGRSVHVPVEFDTLLAAFPDRTRDDARTLLRRVGPATSDGRTAFRRSVERAPAALGAATAILQQLGADKRALSVLVRSTDDVLAAVDRARPQTRQLLTGTAQTLSTVAQQSVALKRTLDRAAQTLRATRRLLTTARPALDDVRDVSARLRPGVTEARRLARPLNRALLSLDAVAAPAQHTVDKLTQAAPRLTTLLGQARSMTPDLNDMFDGATTSLSCIRPFTPEVASFVSTWADFTAATDGKDKLFRAQVQNFLPAATNANAFTSAQAKRAFPQLTFGFPRPPGTSAGQPWFIPECNVTADALNPDRDPEARAVSPLEQLPPLRASVRTGR